MPNADALLTNGLTNGEVSRRLGISQNTVAYHAKAGRLGFVTTKLGRLYDPADVAKLGEQRRQRQTEAQRGRG